MHACMYIVTVNTIIGSPPESIHYTAAQSGVKWLMLVMCRTRVPPTDLKTGICHTNVAHLLPLLAPMCAHPWPLQMEKWIPTIV